MPSEMPIGRLLKVLVAAKPGGRFLELGTGMGLSLVWMMDGMSAEASIVSVDNDGELMAEVRKVINDDRVTLLQEDGDQWIEENASQRFDLIFADTWPGKYRLLDETIDLLAPGGVYVVDDMLPQDNWPEGHAEKAATLRETLLTHDRLTSVELDWSTGIFVATKV